MLQDEERRVAVNYLQKTAENLLETTINLSPVQWKFKPTSDSWSVADICEHLSKTEFKIYDSFIRTISTSPHLQQKNLETKINDQDLLKFVIDRSEKRSAPEGVRPTTELKNTVELINRFKEIRVDVIKYVEATQDNLKEYFYTHPFLGPINAYQWILFFGAHCERHIAQIAEIKSDPTFPLN